LVDGEREAEINHLTSPTSLADLVARHPGRRGIATLKQLLERHADIGRTVTRSDFEVAFLVAGAILLEVPTGGAHPAPVSARLGR
jgi:hypothetical protein